MRKIVLFMLLIFGSALCKVYAQDMDANSMAYMMPGEMHKLLAKCDGIWEAKATFWMGEGVPPQTVTMDCVNDMILGGRYQQSKFKGNMMGMPFEGISLTGFDNGRKIFVTTWIDNMGTGMMYGEGKYDAAKKQIEFKGLSTDPSTGETIDYREVFRFENDNRQVMEMFMVVDGKEMKNMEIVFNRK